MVIIIVISFWLVSSFSVDRTVDLTQVQNVELLEDVQPVYNVSPEQFYIDVDGSQELQVSGIES